MSIGRSTGSFYAQILLAWNKLVVQLAVVLLSINCRFSFLVNVVLGASCRKVSHGCLGDPIVCAVYLHCSNLLLQTC